MLGVLYLLAAFAGASAAVFDQRQSGKTNVRVEVKDAVFIAVGDGEGFGGDYDYNYDYSDLTIKPSHSTSTTDTSPSNSSSAAPTSPSYASTSSRPPVIQSSPDIPTANQSQSVGVLLEAQNNSIIFPNKPESGTSKPVKVPTDSHKPDQIPVLILHDVQGTRPNKFLPVKTVEKHYVSSSKIRGKTSNGTGVNLEELPARHCSPGFFLDDRNRCKRIRIPARDRPVLPSGFRFYQRPSSRR